jgi:ABC-type thiamine transport system substrate-binding protein
LISYNQFGQQVVSKDNSGIPIVAKREIEAMFEKVKSGEMEPKDLKRELDRWGLFEIYQDRFFDLFKRR